MPPTLKDIASRANVSPALVSMYLNKNPKSRMSAETRQRIDAAIREMIYHPSALARSLRSGKSMTIGYAVGNIIETVYGFRTQTLLLAAHKYGYQLLISPVPFYDQEQELDCLSNLLNSRPAGILYNLYLKPDEEMARRLVNYPILQLDSTHPDYCSIQYELTSSFKSVAGLLVNKGVRKLGVAIGDRENRWYLPVATISRDCGLECVFIPDSVARNPEKLWETLLSSGAEFFFSYASVIVYNLLRYCELHGILEPLPSIYSYTLPTDYIAHPSIKGVIVNPFREFTNVSMEMMVHMINHPGYAIEHRQLATQFLDATALAGYYREQMEDPYYESLFVSHCAL